MKPQKYKERDHSKEISALRSSAAYLRASNAFSCPSIVNGPVRWALTQGAKYRPRQGGSELYPIETEALPSWRQENTAFHFPPTTCGKWESRSLISGMYSADLRTSWTVRARFGSSKAGL